MGQHPLDPDDVVFLFKGEVLEAGAVEMTGGSTFEDLLGFKDVFLALVDDVYL